MPLDPAGAEDALVPRLSRFRQSIDADFSHVRAVERRGDRGGPLHVLVLMPALDLNRQGASRRAVRTLSRRAALDEPASRGRYQRRAREGKLLVADRHRQPLRRPAQVAQVRVAYQHPVAQHAWRDVNLHLSGPVLRGDDLDDEHQAAEERPVARGVGDGDGLVVGLDDAADGDRRSRRRRRRLGASGRDAHQSGEQRGDGGGATGERHVA